MRWLEGRLWMLRYQVKVLENKNRALKRHGGVEAWIMIPTSLMMMPSWDHHAYSASRCSRHGAHAQPRLVDDERVRVGSEILQHL